MERYDGLYLCYIDLKKIYKIDHEDIRFVNKYGYALIGDPDKSDGTSMDQEYFYIRDDSFDIILEIDQNGNILLKIIPQKVSSPSVN